MKYTIGESITDFKWRVTYFQRYDMSRTVPGSAEALQPLEADAVLLGHWTPFVCCERPTRSLEEEFSG